jgi:CBS domain-containing protein
MSESVVTVGTGDSIRDAAAKMISDDIEHLPVVDEDGTVAGMLSTTDLTAHLAYLEA